MADHSHGGWRSHSFHRIFGLLGRRVGALVPDREDREWDCELCDGGGVASYECNWSARLGATRPRGGCESGWLVSLTRTWLLANRVDSVMGSEEPSLMIE